ncbi:Bacteriophytochrome cph2 [Jannaschia seosinensis]|uniref:Bacteriophytochrome cph2 n=2 Tax=Jannaschia seosinensis TaxID=313367 RepID=A0A0M7BDJ0_9RHOB|nr:Bacteriophytochrome cph2 [Jannaschia seosinensis]
MKQERIDIPSAVALTDPNRESEDEIIDRALDAVRSHLDMPIAYLCEIVDDRTIFRHVSAPGLEHLIHRGNSYALDEVYCGHILAGNLPNLIPDTGALPLAREMPITAAVPIGSHASLPIHRADGSIYGTLCCLSPAPNPGLNPRDLNTMRLFAELAAEQVRTRLARRQTHEEIANRIKAVIAAREWKMAFQPIYTLSDGKLSSFEALSRFRSDPYRTPDLWFSDAAQVGRKPDLEVAVIETALRALDELDQGVRLSVNAAPDTVSTGGLAPIFARFGAERITLEVTEHERCNDFDRFAAAVSTIRRQGTLVAIDDVGAGYSGLHQILRLNPDILKLDMSLVRDIHIDPARRSLVSAMVHFASETGAQLTAEGIECEEERDVLRDLGVRYGQGYFLGRPGEVSDAADTDPG